MEDAVNRLVFRIAMSAAVAVVVLVGTSDVLAGTVLKTVKLDEGDAKRMVELTADSKQTVYTISVIGQNAVKVNIDLRGRTGSISYPGIFTTTTGNKRP